MTSWKKPTDELVERALSSAKKENDRRYFFSGLKNPLWLRPLVERGYFASPPGPIHLPNGMDRFSFWPELEYLKNIVREVPDEVVGVVLRFPKNDNPTVQLGIIELALQLPGVHSAKLKPLLLNSAGAIPGFLTQKYSELLSHWVTENENSAALQLAQILVRFVPDPESEDKQLRRRQNPQDWTTLLRPTPSVDSWNYREVLEEGVIPLTEREPLKVALILVDATVEMIRLSSHQDHLEQGTDQDYSEIWCPRLSGTNSAGGNEEPPESLVHTLTLACEKVFEQAPDLIPELLERLRVQRWRLFRRLLQHLAALYPSEQTKTLIRSFILKQEHYDRWPHHFEFQQMVRSGCERFGTELLSKEELRRIFVLFLSGPKREYRCEHLTPVQLERFRRHFHRMQLKPFESILFGEYLDYYQQLEDEFDQQISDEAYLQVGKARVGDVRRRSPRSLEDLAALSDEELLVLINDWDSEFRYERVDDEGSWLAEVTVEALAATFQTFFKNLVIPHETRLRYWLDNQDRIERPIYVRAIVTGMREHIEEGTFDELDECLEFCQWVMSHPDQEPIVGHGYDERSKEKPYWHNARQAVGDLVGSCVAQDVDVPVSSHISLAKLLVTLCTQFDARLDRDDLVFPDRNDQFAEAINNTRSRGLESLIKFGLWLRRHGRTGDVHFVTDTLEERFAPKAAIPLTLPEHAILGANYGRLLELNEAWAVEHRSDIFPQGFLLGWRSAFGALLRYTHRNVSMFNVLRDEFEFALQHLADLELHDNPRDAFIDILGQHLFTYYLWGLYPLKGPDSLIERYYRQTGPESEYWGSLFSHIGFMLRHTGKHLDKELRDRLICFFEWRVGAAEAKELARFSRWLEAECLEEEWRLGAFSRILDTGPPDSRDMYGSAETLAELLPGHTELVVECFAKLTDKLEGDSFHIMTEPARRILKAGLDSTDHVVRSNAERARNKLLRKGRFDLLILDN